MMILGLSVLGLNNRKSTLIDSLNLSYYLKFVEALHNRVGPFLVHLIVGRKGRRKDG